MDVRDLVRQHYGAGDLSEAIVSALAGAGTDVDHLRAADLYPVDQLHAGGAAATDHLRQRLDLAPGARVLDVGCGIGGPSRLLASYDAHVTGVDLTPEFVDAATALTERVGLADRATFLTASGDDLPLEDGSFDAAVMVHVGMNIPEKQPVFAEVHRVLAPGARFAVYEQMRTAEGDLPYPLPWAEDARSSFVETADDYLRQLEAAGFTVEDVEDRTPSTAGPPPTGPVNQMVVFGPAFAERIGHNIAATRAGLLGAVLVMVRA